ncbi:MAG: hypothetical protein KatS3mg078_1289 [Deltaproteobacteria bacterium]|nr:MAG: hypothetical protein KatS3mg078_1289 [Deltaproteobacteria bacterium]
MTRITIKSNYIHTHIGAGITWSSSISNSLVENNLITDNQLGMQFGGSDNILINNTFVLSKPLDLPTSSLHPSVYYILLDLRWTSGTGSIIKNNIFYIAQNSFYGKTVYALATTNSAPNSWNVDYNLWYTPSTGTNWIWENSLNKDFASTYKSITSWDNNGPPIPSDPLFVDFGYHIGTNSPARNAGDNSECALTDIDGNTRPLEYTCDIGADEFDGLNSKQF